MALLFTFICILNGTIYSIPHLWHLLSFHVEPLIVAINKAINFHSFHFPMNNKNDGRNVLYTATFRCLQTYKAETKNKIIDGIVVL